MKLTNEQLAELKARAIGDRRETFTAYTVLDLLADLEEAERKAQLPMKYRRMQFNAELQEEIAQLRQQLAEAQAQIEAVRKLRSCRHYNDAGDVWHDVIAALIDADKSALQVAIEQAVAPYKRDAEAIALLATGEWALIKQQPCECFTDEANKRHAWFVERRAPPFCGEDGVRTWSGPTPYEAFQNAIAALSAKETER